MPTRWTQTLIPTGRQVPGDAEVPSHQLMIRAGYIRRLGSGIYDYLPLGVRSLHKVMAVIREEMARAGAVEVFLPTLQPIELWVQTGRRVDYGENLFVVRDRHGREQALGPTHEEVITELVGAYVESYRQLPLTLYQIQTKFRDEYRPRFGVLRSREFQMKDAYSFHVDLASLEETYKRQYDAYCRVFERCGLPCEIVEAESGPIGGSASHEFMVPSPTGEDRILKSDRGDYAANVEKCAIGHRPQELGGAPTGELARQHTPGCATIDDVCRFMKVKPHHMLKTLVFVVSGAGDDAGGAPARLAVAVVRGDHDVNEAKLRAAVAAAMPDAARVELGSDAEVRGAGYAVGYVGPHGVLARPEDLLVIDPDAARDQFWACGANEEGHHVRHFNWRRDALDPLGPAADRRVVVADIRNARDGDPSPRDGGGVLRETAGIEVGHVFKLGTKYAESLGVSVLDEHNRRVPLIMGCYGIGVNRILAAAIERDRGTLRGHDANGIIWPAAIAPYAVLITPIRYEGASAETADRLAAALEAAGLDVLLDDRAERPGVKFKDADLIGIPLRITIGDKGLKSGAVELKPRVAEQAELVPVPEAAARAVELLRSL